MLARGILLQRLLHFVGQVGALAGQVGVLVHFGQNLGSLPQGGHGKEVGRDEERQCRSVVRRTEDGNNQPQGVGGCAPAVVDGSVRSALGLALEAIRAFVLLALLLLEGAQDVFDGLQPVFVEDAGVARHFPIVVSQTQGIAQGIDLPLAFVQLGLHRRAVGLPFAAFRSVVEGVGIRVEVDAQELAADHSLEHGFQLGIFVGELHVRPDLCARVAQPHGVDVARIDKGVGLAVQQAEMYRRVQRVGKTVLEHPRQVGIFQQCLDFGNLLLDDVRLEQPVGRRRALADVASHVIFRRREGHF